MVTESISGPTVAETSRLALRRITSADTEFFAALFADPQVMQFSAGAKSPAETRAWIDRTCAIYDAKGYGAWLVSLREGGQSIGFCGLLDQDVDGEDEVEIAYRLLQPYWGQGFAPEAAAAARDLAFGRFALGRIIALIDPQNSRSVRVAEKIGMAKEKETLKWRRRLGVYVREAAQSAPPLSAPGEA